MKRILILLSLCILFFTEQILTETISNDKFIQRNKELISKTILKTTNNHFFGLLLVPYIICFFAATGIWPHFPQYMQRSVNEMGQQIFSQSDEHIRNFCRGKFLFNAQQSHKPIFVKGVFYPYIIKELASSSPLHEMTQISSTPMKLTTQETTPEIPTETTTIEATTTTTEATTTTTEATTTTTEATTTTTEATTTTDEATTTTEATTQDVSVITFDPNQPPTCNCSIPKLVATEANTKLLKVDKNVNTTPPSTSTAYPSHIKIDIKKVISFIDLILSHFNDTQSKP